ncbi:SDR family oxidoreductase [Tsukamurella soli]|uniref:SDR family oxidoreductase n=1 Tax=Tsukamurella soli TaxID=644556 RepID=A0ABP8JCN5_9ACTN
MSAGCFRGKVAAVTGAGSGIGRALAVGLSTRGARVAVADIDEVAAAHTASLCVGEAEPYLVDVGDRAAVGAFAADVAARFGGVHQIYNNAGIAFNSSVLDHEWADYERVLRVNLAGVIHGTQAFLPYLIDSGDGHVVNISSLNGFTPQPGLSAYCTTKYGVRGFTEVLRSEMLLDRHPVRVTVVHPGGVATSIADSAAALARSTGRTLTTAQEARNRTYTEKLLKMPPDKAARIILDGVARGRPRVRVGSDAVAMDVIARLVPSRIAEVTVALERRILAAERV